jgi:hypothetical protein
MGFPTRYKQIYLTKNSIETTYLKIVKVEITVFF